MQAGSVAATEGSAGGMAAGGATGAAAAAAAGTGAGDAGDAALLGMVAPGTEALAATERSAAAMQITEQRPLSVLAVRLCEQDMVANIDTDTAVFVCARYACAK